MKWLRNKIDEIRLRRFRKNVRDLKFTVLDKENERGMMSQLWETDAFRNWIIKRETGLVLAMTDRVKKPSDEEYLTLFAQRLELMNLHDYAKASYNIKKRERELAKGQNKKSESS